MSHGSILIVEDDRPLAELMSRAIAREGFQTHIESHGNHAVERIRELTPDLVVLDIMLPGLDGFSICREARHFYTQPILMLTAREEDMDQILGLELGADDYVVKPVHPRVLLARIRALLRRVSESAEDAPDATIEVGSLLVRVAERRAFLDTRELELTTSEFNLLLYFTRNAGRIVTREELYRDLRGIEYDGLDRSMDLRVSKLRKRLRGHSIIKTVHGQGYLLVRPAP